MTIFISSSVKSESNSSLAASLRDGMLNELRKQSRSESEGLNLEVYNKENLKNLLLINLGSVINCPVGEEILCITLSACTPFNCLASNLSGLSPSSKCFC